GFAVVPRQAAELPLRKPKLFRAAVSRFSVERAVMRNQALEAIGMAKDPVDHVAAIAGAQSALALLVDERVGLLRVIQAVHQVNIGRSAPIFVHAINEGLSVAGAAAWINHDHYVPAGGEQLGVPAI